MITLICRCCISIRYHLCTQLWKLSPNVLVSSDKTSNYAAVKAVTPTHRAPDRKKTHMKCVFFRFYPCPDVFFKWKGRKWGQATHAFHSIRCWSLLLLSMLHLTAGCYFDINIFQIPNQCTPVLILAIVSIGVQLDKSDTNDDNSRDHFSVRPPTNIRLYMYPSVLQWLIICGSWLQSCSDSRVIGAISSSQVASWIILIVFAQLVANLHSPYTNLCHHISSKQTNICNHLGWLTSLC